MSKVNERLNQVANHLSSHREPRPSTVGQRHNENAPRLSEKVCIITGAGSEQGIGRATAWIYAKNGPKAIYITDYREDLLPQLAKDIQTEYPEVNVIPLQVDAASESAVKLVIQDSLNRFGRLDVFFANAGIATMETQDFEFMNTLKINTSSVFLAIKYASEAMKVIGGKGKKEKPGGSIIATASVAGIRSGAGGMAYSASKAGVINLIKTGACHLANTNIRVNAICPGLIETNMTKPIFDYARSSGKVNRVGLLNPLQRHGLPEEIANVALFLASEESSYVNGHALVVDGGLSATIPIILGKWKGMERNTKSS
ncbi:hypothetical protein G9A89_017088 [Geosiphon pyriformis]|nr:hypothetical protein G9A89_017088 [Geosiphon pyriformis]